MGNKNRKNRKNKKKNKKIDKKRKKVTRNDFKKLLCIKDIFILDEIYLKDSQKIINMEIYNYILSDINIQNRDLNQIFNDQNNINEINKYSNLTYSDISNKSLDLFCNNITKKNHFLEIYDDILQELKKYHSDSTKISKCLLNIPLNNWGQWIYN